MVGSRHHVPKTYHLRRRAVADARWFVCFTNPQCEDRAASGLRAAGYPVFVPERAYWGTRYKRRVRLTAPLFSRYVLVGLPEGEGFYGLRGVDGVERLLRDPVNEQPVEVPSTVIRELAVACATGVFDETIPEPAAPLPASGAKVSVTQGPFEGFTAVVKAAFSPETVEVLLNIFGRETVAKLPLAVLSEAC